MEHAAFDDGVYAGLKKVFVRDDGVSVTFLKMLYERDNGDIVEVRHGVDGPATEFKFEYPDEYITSVAWTKGIYNSLRTLVFKTSERRTSPTFGLQGPEEIPRNVNETTARRGAAVVGFKGRFSDVLLQIDTHLGPRPPRKLEAEGGTKLGEEWDDGKHQNVTKIRMGRCPRGLAFIQFHYKDGTDLVHGAGHGISRGAPFAIEEFDIDQNDHIVGVEIYSEKVRKDEEGGEFIAALCFNTQKGKSSGFYGAPAKGKKKTISGHKIVGFHGRSSNRWLVSLGVRIAYPPAP
ncbi:unnamed protein product [Microthlaspi erraticum]|uniref:Jacalin-type lectin domain-containing protein n=1 Tax=Microthlaspi erraticum TaxID=1685480 RepID=A0A6D2JQH9_9BRAS|nr:unnamed protein product [Microthlaspi erraticum]